jgi:hypothetical protein
LVYREKLVLLKGGLKASLSGQPRQAAGAWRGSGLIQGSSSSNAAVQLFSLVQGKKQGK